MILMAWEVDDRSVSVIVSWCVRNCGDGGGVVCGFGMC